MTDPVVAAPSVAWITEAEMVEVDRIVTEDLDIGLLQMMQNAGHRLARVAIDRFDPDRMCVAAGPGGNEGGGLGRLLLADISVPRALAERPGGAPDFRAGPVVEIDAANGGRRRVSRPGRRCGGCPRRDRRRRARS